VYEAFLKNDTGHFCVGFGSCYYVGKATDIAQTGGIPEGFCSYFPMSRHHAYDFWLKIEKGEMWVERYDRTNDAYTGTVTIGKLYYRRISDI
jgi:hypothetical protein